MKRKFLKRMFVVWLGIVLALFAVFYIHAKTKKENENLPIENYRSALGQEMRWIYRFLKD